MASPSRDHPWRKIPVTGKRKPWDIEKVERIRVREAWFDACSDPPDESDLYGETLVIEGERVGEERMADWSEPDEMPIRPSHHASARPLSDEEREALIELQRKPPPKPKVETNGGPSRLTDEEERELIRARLRAMPLPPELAESWRRFHDGEDYDDVAEGKRRERERRQQEEERRAWHEEQERKRFAEAVEEAKKPKARREPQWYDPTPPPPEWYDPNPPTAWPRIVRQPEAAVQTFVRLTSNDGIEHVIPLDIYERYGREAIPLGVDPPIWVLYRLGFGWNE